MQNFFQPSVDCIVNAVLGQRNMSETPISVCCKDSCVNLNSVYRAIQHVVLVGGFAASDWLFENLQSSLAPAGLNVLRPENYV